ncbi:MarR family winged helix-turn-helix transcriptional regulator [Ligilactobacillus animalis]|uniref:MarR family transcriptional regulator n=2 Tax=Ligilactobacillus animalis TaxID=1605 RepID=A0AAJ6FXF6_9LACO|nr:MarR family transcriptional regulator [Ligilactobacillus animalis]KRM58345.1 MarR family transcriptional regulator [Ligilactobacillus animalis KCTC 3501 = DSM 20602]MBU5279558.1 MarR family transcriptional regulator [Ligilactobacillus animalis]MDQ2234289.1 MarR family transcriptional regulator [Ligilactobacillus animalis]MDU1487638.1 MarR family transcriptional regulator [Ligilactobacillus animalis]MDU3187404.1 MarR family transcriptional regulator [Ligilactobacillus animalis]
MNRESLIFMRISQLQRQLLANSAEVLQQAGITNAQYDILNHLYNHAGCTQKELATTLIVTKGNITQIITKMEKLELITRKQVGKTKQLFVAERGSKLYSMVTPKLEAAHAEALAGLNSNDQKQLLKLLKLAMRG